MNIYINVYGQITKTILISNGTAQYFLKKVIILYKNTICQHVFSFKNSKQTVLKFSSQIVSYITNMSYSSQTSWKLCGFYNVM